MKNTLSRLPRISTLAAAITAAVLLPQAQAAEPQAGAQLEQVIVTAQKREESLTDVPISVNVVDAERIEAANINKIADLTEFVPNLSMTETGASTQLYVRGIGSGNNQGFEQSVGQYVDGIYYGRHVLMRAPYLDLDRIEVLRGPQSTLFGKNSIAGALNYTTARPTDEKELSIYALHEFESEQTEATFVASGPLSDSFRARFAFRDFQEDGYIRNTLQNRDEPNRDEQTARLTLDWDINDRLTASLKMEKNDFDTRGRQVEIVRDGPNLFPAGSTPIAGLNTGQILKVFGQPTLEGDLNYERQSNAPEQMDAEMENLTLTVSYDMDFANLTSVTGRVEYDYAEDCDCDYTPANSFTVFLGETYKQVSQEFRLSSPSGNRIEWMVGAFFQNAKMKSKETLDIPSDSLLRTLALTSTDAARRALIALPGTRLHRDNGQDSDTAAAFAQVTWNFSDTLRFSVGGRFTEEEKTGFRVMNVLDIATGKPTVNPLAPIVYFGAFRIYSQQLAGVTIAPGVVAPGHSLQGERSESQFTPSFIVEWDMNDNSMLYASATSGYKAGGFDGRANNPFSFEFEEEEARSFEVGAKNRLFDDRLELNLAYFFTDYDDLQVSQFDGTFGFNVGNAKKTEVEGLELDGRWAASENLTVGFSYSWLDFQFKDFINGNCHNRQTATGPLVNGVRLCDYSGKRGQYTPEHSASLAFDYVRPFNNGLTFISSLMVNYRSEQNVHDNLDPLLKIGDVTRLNLRLGIENENWQVGFIGKNLTEEKVITYAGNVPLSSSTFGTNTFYGFIDRGRQLAVEAGYKF